MKKVLALIIAAMMIISMIPVMAITTSAADVEGDWITYRSAADYEEPEAGEEESYKPAPGYEYTDEGFHMISPDYTGTTPFGTIQSKEPVSIKDGVYMQLRIDDYGYGGENNSADHWISFHIWDSQKIAPGDGNYGQGWVSLNRTPGAGGSGNSQSFNSTPGGLETWHGDVNITPELDDNGKEIYTFEIAYDGTNYTISICGVAVAGNGAAITDHLNSLNADGEFYIGVTFHSGVAGAKNEATILKFGTSAEEAETPIGSDSAEPEDNINVTAPLGDSSTVPEGQPAMIFDANETSWGGRPATQHLVVDAQGNGSFKLTPTQGAPFLQWSIKKSISWQAQDFPVVAFLIEDPNEVFEGGVLRYSAGLNMSADEVHKLDFSVWHDSSVIYGEDEQYALIVMDLKELLTDVDAETGEADDSAYIEGWSDRINGLRFDFTSLYLTEPEVDPETDFFFLHWAGVFRSSEDAANYCNDYLDLEPATAPEETTSEEPDVTEPDTSEANGSEEATDASTGEAGTNGDAQTEAATKAEEGGCASVIGSVAVLMAAAAAAVVLKKRD